MSREHKNMPKQETTQQHAFTLFEPLFFYTVRIPAFNHFPTTVDFP